MTVFSDKNHLINIEAVIRDTDLNEIFAGYLERFFSYLYVEKDFSSHTIRAYLKDVQEFLVFLQKEGCTLKEADVQFLRSYFTERTGSRFIKKAPDQRAVTGKSSNRKLSPRSQARKLSSLKTFFQILVRDDIISENPLSRISSPRFYRSLPPVLKQDVMFDILELFGDVQSGAEDPEIKNPDLFVRDRAIYEMLYSTGMRIAELLSINLGDIQSGDSRLKIMGKGRRERIVFIGEEARAALNDYISVRGHFHPVSEKLFLNSRGAPLDQRGVRYRLSMLKKKMGLNISLHPHKFRHSFATDLLNSGADIRAVQEMLGHKSISSTQIYTGVSKDRLREIHRNCHPHGKKTPKNP